MVWKNIKSPERENEKKIWWIEKLIVSLFSGRLTEDPKSVHRYWGCKIRKKIWSFVNLILSLSKQTTPVFFSIITLNRALESYKLRNLFLKKDLVSCKINRIFVKVNDGKLRWTKSDTLSQHRWGSFLPKEIESPMFS